MNDKNEAIPEGMERYEVLGISFIAAPGMTPEITAMVAESMVAAGVLVFDPVTEQLKPNPDNEIEDGKLYGLTVNVSDDGEIGNVSKIPDDQLKKDFGTDNLFVGNKIPTKKEK